MFLYVGGARCVEKNIAGERKMKKNDSVKRLIILALGLIGLCVLTAFYARDWFAYYYHHIAWKTHNLSLIHI